jgi:hypothetical protein
LLYRRVFGRFGKLPKFCGFVPKIISPIHSAGTMFDGSDERPPQAALDSSSEVSGGEYCIVSSHGSNSGHKPRNSQIFSLRKDHHSSFPSYRGPFPLARAAVRDHNPSIQVCARWAHRGDMPTIRRQPSGGRTTQNITPLFGPTCLGAHTWAPPSGATTLLILSLGTGAHLPSTLTS